MKNKPIIIIGVTALIIIAIGFFLIWPTASSLWKGWRDLSSSQSELKKAQEKSNAVSNLRKNKEQITNVAAIAEKYIPKTYESSQLVLEITAIANDNHLTIQETVMEKTATAKKSEEGTESATPNATPSVSPSGSPSASAGLQNINFSMKLTGSYGDFLNFLKTIETSSKLTVIKSIALVMDTTGSGLVTAQISGASFYKPKISIAETTENIVVPQTTIDMFLNLKSFAQPINPAESGYGRGDPFSGY